METEQLPIDFGDLELRLDPWQVDYGDQTLVESPSAEPAQGIDVEVEVEGPWRPIVPPEAPEARPPLIFVDGVRRLEARVIVQARGAIAHGVFATYAVGSVEIGGEARFGTARIERVILLGSGIRPAAVEVSAGLLFRPESTEDQDPDAPVNEVQALMQRSEAELVGELATEDGALVIADGPLHFDQPFQRAVGYVKRFARLYVPASHLGVLARLPAGGRTPLFGLKRGGFARFAWYLRLADPLPGESDLAGLVRLEVAASLGLADARALADTTCRFLPPLSTRPWQDPRAPQNLVPIGALERHLIRLLGDRLLVRRRLQTHMAREMKRA